MSWLTAAVITPVIPKKIASPTEVHPIISLAILTCSVIARLHPVGNGGNRKQLNSGQQEIGGKFGKKESGPYVPQHCNLRGKRLWIEEKIYLSIHTFRWIWFNLADVKVFCLNANASRYPWIASSTKESLNTSVKVPKIVRHNAVVPRPDQALNR